MNRSPAVSGTFYPSNPNRLKQDIDRLMPLSPKPRNVFGVLSPHAGYLYSGSVAGKVFGGIEVPKTVLLLGPNHSGKGAPLSLYPDGVWDTPLGPVPICETLNALLLKHCPILETDRDAHAREHSLETQIPFLLCRRPDLEISAVCLGVENPKQLRLLGQACAAAILEFGRDVLIVASSDMTHYESAQSAEVQDHAALEKILQLDELALLETVKQRDISMCGRAPAAAMICAAKLLGANRATLVDYTHSGKVTGDDSSVVAYAGVWVE